MSVNNINLPEPIFVNTNPETIENEWVMKFEEESGKTLQPAQPERLLVAVGAYRESLVKSQIQEVAKSLLLAYAEYPVIDYLGELVGKTRLPEQKAQTTIRYTLSEIQTFVVNIPAGSIINSKDGKVSFETVESQNIAIGSLYADITAECETAGEIGNGYLAGQINVMGEPIAYVSGAENITTSSGGADEETTENYRERIRLAPEENSSGGKEAYKSWTRSVHQDIIDVAVITPNEPVTLSYKVGSTTYNGTIDSAGNITGTDITSGTINRSTGQMHVVFSSAVSEFTANVPRGGKVYIYPLTKTGAPSTELKNEILAALNDETVRPLGDLVSVLDPTRVDFTITANITIQAGADLATVLANVNTALDSYIASLKDSLKKDVKRSEIITIIYSTAGVENLTLPNPSADIILTENEWSNCTAKTVTGS